MLEKAHSFYELIGKISQTHEILKGYALKAVNVSLTVRNWLFGFYIVEYEQNGEDKAKYGKHLLENLSESLSGKGLKNIAIAELSRFRQFYIAYPQILGTLSQESLHLPKQILETLSQDLQTTTNQISVEPIKLITNLSFSHFSELIKIEDSLKRTFYEIECIKGVWGTIECVFRTLQTQGNARKR